MKRKIFTIVLSAAVIAATVLPVTASAAGRSFCCPNWCCHIQCPEIPETPDIPEVPDVPVVPDAPEVPDVPVVPDVPEKPDVPETPETPDIDNSAITQLELEAMKLVNEERASNGLDPLTISQELTVKSRIKSQDMKEQGYFSHNSPTYGSPFEMMKKLGITYRSAGENIAMGYRTAEAVVNAWMNSPSHRENILSTRYTAMGIGHTDGYWTQWFIG